EVIHRDVRYAPVRRRQSPVRWLKDRLAHAPGRGLFSHHGEGAVATAEADPTRRPHPMLNGGVATPTLPSQGIGMTQLEPGDHPLPAATTPDTTGSTLHRTLSGPPVLVDRDRQVIKLRLSYTSAGIAAFTVIVALALAFILGRGGPETAEVPES